MRKGTSSLAERIPRRVTKPVRKRAIRETRASTDAAFRLDLLIHEYRALYPLVALRISSLERRIPVGGGAFAAFLLSATVLPLEGKILLLLGLPISLAWYLRTTINHALSFEDLLRRIGEIEERVNALVGERLLAFQSTHPNRNRVGGRTGTGTVQSVFLACVLILAGCLVLVQSLADLAGTPYNVYVLAVVLYLTGLMAMFHRYRYRRNVSSPDTV